MKDKGVTEVHLAVLLFGLSGLFGKLISLPSIIIVLGRVCFSSIFLFLLLVFLKKDIRLNRKRDYLYLTLCGVILALHWSTFFQSIKVSTVAVGLLTFSTFPVFVTFLEPLFFKERLEIKDIIISLITFLGVALILPDNGTGTWTSQGVIWGLISGFTYGILSILNRNFVKSYSGIIVAFYEQCAAFIIMLPFLFLQNTVFSTEQILLLVLLGVVFTGVSHTLFISSLKSIKTQKAGIISCLEPVYGIVFSIFLIGEIPDLREIIGGAIILSASFYSTFKKI